VLLSYFYSLKKKNKKNVDLSLTLYPRGDIILFAGDKQHRNKNTTGKTRTLKIEQ
jgi:hypothetical protein